MISIKDNFILEENSVYYNMPVIKLMENAGKEIAKSIKTKNKNIVIFCGHGNNGGDGFVAARYLAGDNNVAVLFFGEVNKLKHESRKNFGLLKGNGKVKIVHYKNKQQIDEIRKLRNVVQVDCLLGTGVSGKPREPIASAIKLYNSLLGYKVSVDMPSANLCECDLLIAIHDIKEGTKKAKKTRIVDIGFPKMAKTHVGPGEVKSVVAGRNKDSHKGQNGIVLVVGGNEAFVGAVALAGLAALRSGCDLVIVAAPEKVAWAVNCLSHDLITKKLPGKKFEISHIPAILDSAKKADVVLIGNGIGLESKDFVKKLVDELNKMNKPLVLDADGVKSVGIEGINNAIITPHTKELEIFLENSNLDKINKIRAINKKTREIQKIIEGNVILLKGRTDYIISKDKVKLNNTGNAGLTKGGTGDILAGLAAGFLAQSKDRFNSACAAAFINGRIGDILLKRHKGYSYIASDMAREIRRLLHNV